MTKYIGEGATANEAIENTLEKYGFLRDEVKAEIIDKGRKGFLGFMSKPAKIQLEVINLSPEERARFLLKKIIEDMGFTADIKVEKKDGKLLVDISSKDASHLIGRRGETLYAMEHILTKALSNRNGSKINVEIDIDSYRKKRKNLLNREVKKAVEKVKKNKKTVSLPALYIDERKIVYRLIKRYHGIKARSIGTGDFKRVVISTTSPKNRQK
ncbi:MAG: KH domain-containing protein [Candidatus Schekmanbacteria bacterium]|nr:MAG: KH domain-containing protein [Candidatus Schekmanbacteria bacterium]